MRIALVALIIACLASSAAAQSPVKIPRRPKLPATQDTNSALAYYQLGMDVLARDVSKATDAFYWASRIDPGWAAPIYGRYAAMLLTRPGNELTLYLTNRRKALTYDHFVYLDSLKNAAELKNPFVDRRLDATILQTWLQREYGPNVDLRDLGRYDRRFTAWAAYARNDFPMATTVYRDEIRRHPDDINLLFSQGRNFFSQGEFDSARVNVQAAMDVIRGAEKDVEGWVPHAFGEYSVGFLYGVTKQYDSARAAYERSLLDDLTFHPAHRELGRIRLIMGDTVGAISEFTEALNVAPDEASYLYELGLLLMSRGKADSASKLFKRSIEVEPWYAPPYLPLGFLYERSGFTAEAAANYTIFIQRAALYMDSHIANAKQRLARLNPQPTAP